MEPRRIHTSFLASAILLTLLLTPVSHPAPTRAGAMAVQGRVLFRTGAKKEIRPDTGAKVWLFRGREKLAGDTLKRLQQFEKQFPRGLTRVEDRPKENEVRLAAMVLMTYASVHKESLQQKLPVAPDGSFRFQWDGREPVTVIVESAATIGSYHMPRYAVATLEPGRPVRPLRFDFGISHLEDHPTAPVDRAPG